MHGLTEAEVNLGVALELDEPARAARCDVLMTRATDRDFLTPADSSLKADLTERVRLANEFHPDLFVSIHHNADARGAHDVNETQTYYKLGDDGPSLDAAGDVHRYLVRNLGDRALPHHAGQLLRAAQRAKRPAILTESSYITNPDVEAKLVLDEKRRLEAEALFLGLARYFGRHGAGGGHVRGAPDCGAFRQRRSGACLQPVLARARFAARSIGCELDARWRARFTPR